MPKSDESRVWFLRRLVRMFNNQGYCAKRGVKRTESDILGLNGIFVRALRRQNVNIRRELMTASKHCGDGEKDPFWGGKLVTLLWERPGEDPTVSMMLDDWLHLYGYMDDFVRLATWHEVGDYGEPPEPKKDIWRIGEVPPEEIDAWIDENFEAYLAWKEGAERPDIFYYAGDGRWVDRNGRFVERIVLWKELPHGKRDRVKLTPISDGV